jgi:hypothetical protein
MKSWKTTLGGILIGIPPLVQTAAMASGVSLGKWGAFAMSLLLGLGGLIVGLSAKDGDVHSTATEVDQATKKL